MNKIVRVLSILFAVFLFCLSTNAIASQCFIAGTSVDVRDGFCFTFKIDSDGKNRVRLEGKTYYPLWTDDIKYKRYNPAIYEVDYIDERKERTFQVKFTKTSGNNKKIRGVIVYYVDGELIEKIDNFDLSHATGVSKRKPMLRLNVVGSEFYNKNDYCISSGSCFRDNLELCRYFPQPAQSWKENSSVTFNNNTATSGPYPYFIGGWSKSYLDEHLNLANNELAIAFGKVSHIDETNVNNKRSCESGKCTASNFRIAKPELIRTDYGTKDLVVDVHSYNATCPSDGSGKYCVAIKKGNKIFVTIKSDLRSLSVNGGWKQGEINHIEIGFTSQPGTYGRKLGTYITGNYVRSVFNQPGVYTFESINFNNPSELEVGRNVTWKVKSKVIFENTVDLINPSSTDDFIIYAPEADLEFKTVNGDYNGLILADSLTMHNKMTIFGAVTTNKLHVHPQDATIVGQSQCFTLPPEPDVKRIEIKPFNYHLTCESSPDNMVEVHVYDEDGSYVPGKIPTLKEQNGSNLNIKFVSESAGIAKYQVTKMNAGSIGVYSLQATLLSQGEMLIDEDEIKYVPYKFVVDDQYIVAGEKHTFPVNVKACSNDGQLISLGYNGNPKASFVYKQPLTTPIANDLKFSAILSDTNRDADLTFLESGHITVEIVDSGFQCDDERCPIEGGTLKGEFELKSRPYKLAICDVKETAVPLNLNPATTTEGNGFMASGRDFSITYIPILHPDSKGTALNECDHPITGNYALDNGPLELSYHLAYPASGDVGEITPTVTPNFAPSSEILTLGHSWNEVGTIAFNTDATYLTMPLDRDTQNIGRFYPNHFVISESTWMAPDNQNGITYLSQPFKSAAIKVGAFAYGSTDAVKNYRFFTSDLQAKFSLQQDSVVDNELVLDIVAGSWQEHAGASYWVLDDDAASVNRISTVSGSTITSKENGPFNIDTATDSLSTSTDFGLEISGKYDPVSFDAEASIAKQAFSYQPLLRFGRMILGSSGGQSGQELSVPLRVEYWNGSQFTLNTDDSRSELNSSASYVCKQTMWNEGSASDSQLSGASSSTSVTHGEFDQLTAKADSTDKSIREQIRFWLRLDDTAATGHTSPQVSRSGVTCGTNSTAQPWLQYNWSGLGDEDPSTVATFGIFRGNDKIIFRGESGLIGL